MTFDTGNSVKTAKQNKENRGDLNLRELMCETGDGTMWSCRDRLCTPVRVATVSANANSLCFLSDDGCAQSCCQADRSADA